MRVLVVDDESINRFLLVHMLEEEGYLDIYEARTGHEAIILAEKIKFDLVLLDVVMPGMDGFEVAQRLKSANDDNYLPIIFITSLDERDTVVRCLDVGGDDFVSKPFDRTVMLAKVKAHLRTRELSKKISHQNRELTYFRHSVEREREIIEHIFNNAIINNPAVNKFFEYRNFPADEFSGDVFLCESSPNGGLYFLLGDFTGHGLASAIGALPVSKAFQTMASKGLSVSEIAATLNNTLVNLLPVNMFFAASIVEVNESGCRFSVWNGGMPDMLLQSPDGSLHKRFCSQHMALGILEPNEFDDQDEVFEAEPGSRLLAYSDGLIELTNSMGEMLGEQALEDSFIGSATTSIRHLLSTLRDFMGDSAPHDDITLTIFTCKPLTELRQNNKVSTLPFCVTAVLEPEQLRDGQAVQYFLDMICSQLGVSWRRSDLFTVMTELYSNALEHGVLDIDSSMKNTSEGFIEYYNLRSKRLAELMSGNITICAQFAPSDRLLTISVSDSGRGFDVEQLRSPQLDDNYGRGFPLIKTYCETLEFNNSGTKATVTLRI